jgi:hypothetical protein
VSISLALFVGRVAVDFRGLASLRGCVPMRRSRGGVTLCLDRLCCALVRKR